MADAKTSLGDIIRHQREMASLTMRQLSAMVGISNPYLSQIETGLREPSKSVLHAIAQSLGVPPDELVPEGCQTSGVREAITGDPGLTAKQRRALIEVYDAMIAATAAQRG